MSDPRPDSLMQAALAHVARAFDAIGEILADKTAPAATRLRAAFGIIELAYGKPTAQAGRTTAEAAAVLAASAPALPRKESLDERFARLRREKAAARAARPAPA